MRQPWAVARNLLLEVWRIRPLVVFLVLALTACTFGMAWWLHLGEGPGDHKVQTFISYSLGFSAFILALLTIFLAVATVARDIKRREIFTIATKPITRGQFLAGKVLGLALLNLILLALIGAAVYATTFLLTRTQPRNDAERSRLNDLVLTARDSVLPQLAEIDPQQLAQQIEQIARDRIEAARAEMEDPSAENIESMRILIAREVEKQITLAYRSAPPGGHVVWRFSGIKPDPDLHTPIYLRYKLEPAPDPPNLQLLSEWHFSADPDALYTTEPLVSRDTIRTVIERPLPPNSVGPDGELYVVYRNAPQNCPTRVIFPLPDGADVSLEALFVTGGFTSNFLRALACLYLRLLFLALLGVAMGAWLSLPVAVLVVLIVFTLGSASEFILDAIKWNVSQQAADVTAVLVQLLPRLAYYDPVEKIQNGRVVSYALITRQLIILIILKGGLAALFGYLVFRFRELARVTV
jgi:diacylglycerol kinase